MYERRDSVYERGDRYVSDEVGVGGGERLSEEDICKSGVRKYER